MANTITSVKSFSSSARQLTDDLAEIRLSRSSIVPRQQEKKKIQEVIRERAVYISTASVHADEDQKHYRICINSDEEEDLQAAIEASIYESRCSHHVDEELHAALAASLRESRLPQSQNEKKHQIDTLSTRRKALLAEQATLKMLEEEEKGTRRRAFLAEQATLKMLEEEKKEARRKAFIAEQATLKMLEEEERLMYNL